MSVGKASTPTDTKPEIRISMARHSTAYYVSARIGSQNLLCMLDSGCSRSLIPHQVYQELPTHCKTPLDSISGRGVLANGEAIQLYGVTQLRFGLKGRQFTCPFIVADVSPHILLGLDFFEAQNCRMDFQHCTLHCGDLRVQCSDENGAVLKAGVQVRRNVTIPGNSEVITTAQINKVWAGPTAVIENNSQVEGLVCQGGNLS